MKLNHARRTPELVQYVKLITNKLQILIFSGVNILNGKKKQRLAENASHKGCNESELHRESVQQSSGQTVYEGGREGSSDNGCSSPIEEHGWRRARTRKQA